MTAPFSSILWLPVAVALVACGGRSSGVAPAGGLRQACYPNGTCNAGLTCLSEVCVDYAGPDGGSHDAGSDGGGAGSDGGADAQDSGTAADAGPTVAEAAAAMAQANCSKMVTCFGAAVGFADLETCVTREELAFTDLLEAPGTSLIASSEVACASAVTEGTCADWFNYALPACQEYVGSLPLGTACAYDVQCSTGYCGVANGSVCGVCAALPDGGSTAPGGVGATCSTTTSCLYPLGCQNGTCQEAGIGAACSPTTQDCTYNEYCSSTTTTCEAFVWSAAGTTCGFIDDNDSVWSECLTASCAVPAQAWTSTCPALANDGQTCSGSAVCVSPAVCSAAGTCTVPHAASCQ
jgi:hypothetical protein